MHLSASSISLVSDLEVFYEAIIYVLVSWVYSQHTYIIFVLVHYAAHPAIQSLMQISITKLSFEVFELCQNANNRVIFATNFKIDKTFDVTYFEVNLLYSTQHHIISLHTITRYYALHTITITTSFYSIHIPCEFYKNFYLFSKFYTSPSFILPNEP